MIGHKCSQWHQQLGTVSPSDRKWGTIPSTDTNNITLFPPRMTKVIVYILISLAIIWLPFSLKNSHLVRKFGNAYSRKKLFFLPKGLTRPGRVQTCCQVYIAICVAIREIPHCKGNSSHCHQDSQLLFAMCPCSDTCWMSPINLKKKNYIGEVTNCKQIYRNLCDSSLYKRHIPFQAMSGDSLHRVSLRNSLAPR